tara:strand:- start:218 stop:1270 length:1053 start_codon:yes stop_codon:yes gene_type:complete
MAKILVTSSPNRDNDEFAKSHPGTTKDDVFIISESSHGFPLVNSDENLQGGNDIYRLSLDINPDKKEPHPYGEGGGTPIISGFNPSKDQIILPKEVDLEDIVINNYDHQPNSIYQRAEIRYDPSQTLEKIYDPLGKLGKFSGGLLKGKTLIFTVPHTSELLTGTDYNVAQKKDPTGYQQWLADVNERAQLLGQETIAYGADDIGDISFTGSLDEFFQSIKDRQGRNLYDYTLNRSSEENTSEQLSTAITRASKFNKKSADKITNFNPSTDTLEIDTGSFGIDNSATFASSKNKKTVKKKLAKQDIDFLYDEKKGGLYFNENGAEKGFGEGGIIAILKGSPDLTASNLEFV